ncbi:MAG: hypothetical protein HYY06_03495 [Deltaproteobacteria bacterium]|nr:hypothetical protein [Deltaproteobacteria bacterium]
MSASPRRSPLRTLLTLAWPIVVARSTQAVVGFADALMVAPLGEEPLAAVTTGAMNAFALIILPLGTVFIIQSFAAQLRGRGELDAVRRYGWYGPSEALVETIATMLAMAVAWQLFDAIGMTLSEALRAAGDTAWCMWARIALAWLLFAPAATVAVLVFGGGVPTVMSSVVLYLAALAAVYGYRFRSGRWRRIDLVGHEPIVA